MAFSLGVTVPASCLALGTDEPAIWRLGVPEEGDSVFDANAIGLQACAYRPPDSENGGPSVTTRLKPQRSDVRGVVSNVSGNHT